jgi:hypothetical protein
MATTIATKEYIRVSKDFLAFHGIILKDFNDGKMTKCFIVEGKRFIVKRIRNISRGWFTYTAWEEDVNHSTITSTYKNDDLSFMERTEPSNVIWWGQVGCCRLPPEIGKLPQGEERIQAIQEFYEEQYQLAYQLIIEAFPEASCGRKYAGNIDLFFEDTDY